MNNAFLAIALVLPSQEGGRIKYSFHSKGLNEVNAKMVDLLLTKEMKSIDGFLDLRNQDLLKVRIVDVSNKRYFMFFDAKETDVVVFVVSDISTLDDVGEDRIINKAFGAYRKHGWGLSHIRRGQRFESQGGLGTYEDIRSAISTGAEQCNLALVRIQR